MQRDGEGWKNPPEAKNLQLDGNRKDRLHNIFYVDNSSKLIVICEANMFLLEANTLETLKTVTIQTGNDRIAFVSACRPALKDEFIFAFIMYNGYATNERKTGFNPCDLPQSYEGKNRMGKTTWLMKF